MNLINHQAKIKLTSIEATKQACDSQSCLQVCVNVYYSLFIFIRVRLIRKLSLLPSSSFTLQSEPPKAMGKQSNNQPKLQTLGHQYRDLYSSSCVLMKNE